MKTLMLAAALAVAFVSTSAQADQPAVLRGVAKKQTLTSQQMRQVRGEGGCCGPLLSLAACVNAKVNVNTGSCNNPCGGLLGVNANVGVHAVANVAGLVNANVCVPAAVHIGL